MKHIAKIELKHEYTAQEVNDLVLTGMESALSNWCGSALMARNEDGTLHGVLPEDRSNVHLWMDVIGFGGTLILSNVDNDGATTDEYWTLNSEKLMNGISMYCTQSGYDLDEIINNYDAETADDIIQYALFGELVYN